MASIGDYFGRAARLLKNLREQVDELKREERELKITEQDLAAVEVNGKQQKVEISTVSVVKSTIAIFGLVALAWFFMAIQNVIIIFLIAAFLSVAFDPFVDYLQRWKIPRGIGILLIYIIFFGLAGVVIAAFIPILTTEIPNLVSQTLGWLQTSFGIDTSLIQDQLTELENYLASIQQNLSQENIKIGLDVLGTVSQNAIAVIKSVAGSVFKFGLVLVVTFFMVIEENGIKHFLIRLFPRRYRKYIIEKASAVEGKFGAWLRGQIVLMIVMGLITFVALKVAGIHYAATLATLAGFTELIPYVGPVLALVPALIIAASQGGWVLALVVIAIYMGIQQLEGNLLVPLVMKKAVGLSPVVVLFAMLVGTSFPDVINPIVGIILSVPVATAISVFVEDYAEKKK